MEIDALRFWIGSETERVSSVWRIWDKGGSVYLTSTAFGGDIKLSVHSRMKGNPSSEFVCQFGLTSAHRRQRDVGQTVDGVKTFVRWKRKQAMPGEGHELARLYFPTDLLRKPQAAPTKKGRKFQNHIEPAPAGKCVLMRLIALARPASPGDCWQAKVGPKTIVHMPLGQSEQCIVIGHHCDFDPRDLPLGKEINIPTERLGPKLQSMEPGETTRDFSTAFWTHPNDFEAIHIADTSGLNLTLNSRMKMPR